MTNPNQDLLDSIDRLRMAAGEDFRMPVDQLVNEVARMFGIQQRAYEATENAEPTVKATAWWICTGEGDLKTL